MRRALEAVRRSGVAIEDQEAVIGEAEVAAAVFDHDGHPVGAIGVVGPVERLLPRAPRPARWWRRCGKPPGGSRGTSAGSAGTRVRDERTRWSCPSPPGPVTSGRVRRRPPRRDRRRPRGVRHRVPDRARRRPLAGRTGGRHRPTDALAHPDRHDHRRAARRDADARQEPAIPTQGAILAEGGRPVVAAGPAVACQSLVTPGTLGECGEVPVAGTRVIWVVERAPTAGGATATTAPLGYVPDESGWVEWL